MGNMSNSCSESHSSNFHLEKLGFSLCHLINNTLPLEQVEVLVVWRQQ